MVPRLEYLWFIQRFCYQGLGCPVVILDRLVFITDQLKYVLYLVCLIALTRGKTESVEHLKCIFTLLKVEYVAYGLGFVDALIFAHRPSAVTN